LRYAARMGFKIEQRTQEWFDLAIERNLQETIPPEDAGDELRAIAREERPAVSLKAWEEHDLLEAVNPLLAKKHPAYDAIGRLMKVREDLFTAGFRPRLAAPMLLAILGKLKDRELANVLSNAGFRSAEAEAVLGFAEEAFEAQKELVGRKMNAPADAFRFLEKMPLDQIAYLMAESNKSAALSKIRAFLNKWRPIRIALPVVATELEALGMPRGTKFDQIVEQVFSMQLTGRGKTKEEREKILRKLSGIKEPPKKKEKEKKPPKGTDKAHAAAAMGDAANKKHAAAKAEAKHAAKGKPVPAKSHAKHAAHASHGKSGSAKKSHARK
jgi:tRNA nucleotidyltransferase (CCA-adding enzyme)